MSRVFAIITGVLLILAAVKSPVVQIIGKPATGIITKIEKNYSRNAVETRNLSEKNYKVSYSFKCNGNAVSGAYFKNNVYNISTLPATGSLIPVKYIDIAPGILNSTSKEELGLSNLIMLGLGFLILLFGNIVSGKREKAAPMRL